VVTATLADQATVGVVEEEVPLKLLPGRRPSEPPERCRLPIGEELHAHTQAQVGGGLLGLSFNPARLLLTPQYAAIPKWCGYNHRLELHQLRIQLWDDQLLGKHDRLDRPGFDGDS